MCLCIKSVHGNTKRLCLPHSHKQVIPLISDPDIIGILFHTPKFAWHLSSDTKGERRMVTLNWTWQGALYMTVLGPAESFSQDPPSPPCLGAGPCYVDTSGLQSKLCPLAKAGQWGQPHFEPQHHEPQQWPTGLIMPLQVKSGPLDC